MQESVLTHEARAAIRKYILSLMVIPSVVIAITGFCLGVFIRVGAEQNAYEKAYVSALSKIQTAASDVAAARSNASAAAMEVENSLKEAKAGLLKIKTNEAIATSEKTVDRIVDTLVKRSDFTQKITENFSEQLSKLEELEDITKGEIEKLKKTAITSEKIVRIRPQSMPNLTLYSNDIDKNSWTDTVVARGKPREMWKLEIIKQ